MGRFTKLVVTAVAGLSLTASAAAAQAVAYSTTGSFSGGSCIVGSTSCTVTGVGGSATVSFLGEAAIVTGTPVDGSSLGTFTLSSTAGSGYSFDGISFLLTVTQSFPSAGSAPITSNFSGTFRQNPLVAGGPISLTFENGGAFSIDPVRYQINTDGVINLRLPGTGGSPRNTDLTAAISTVPEPSTYALLGTGIIGLAGLARRRRNVA